MEYTVPFHSEISGDAIPLRYIAEAMARKAASTFGTRKLHSPTLINTRTRYESSLLDAARKGSLKVCGSDGIVGSVGELVNAAEGIPEKCSDNVKAMLALYVKRQHLNEWAMTNGDVFCLMDVPADVLEFGPERPDGTKEYRGYVGWPFDYFGEHGYLDVELGGIPIELADDDFETDGFVKVASAVTAIAKFLLSKGAPNKFQAERDAWPHILTGVAKGALHPINPDTLQVLSVEYCGNGMVPFSELVTWGRTTKLFAFRRAADAVGNDDDAAEGGGGAVEQFEKQNPNVGTMDQAQAVALEVKVSTGQCEAGNPATCLIEDVIQRMAKASVKVTVATIWVELGNLVGKSIIKESVTDKFLCNIGEESLYPITRGSIKGILERWRARQKPT